MQVSTWRLGGQVGRKPTIQKRAFWRKNKWLAESACHIHISLINKLLLWTFQSLRNLSVHIYYINQGIEICQKNTLFRPCLHGVGDPGLVGYRFLLFCFPQSVKCADYANFWGNVVLHVLHVQRALISTKQRTSLLLTTRVKPHFEPFQKAVQGRLNFLCPIWKTVQERLLQECQFTRACWLLQVCCKVFANFLAITSIHVLCPV